MDRTKLTFEQAEGREPLPTQLQLREINPRLTALLWNVIHPSFEDAASSTGTYGGRVHIDGDWLAILKAWHVYREHRLIDEFDDEYDESLIKIKSLVTSKDYTIVFGFLQYVIRHSRCPSGLAHKIRRVLEIGHAAYRLIDKTIMPISSDEQAESIASSFKLAESLEAEGPSSHLRAAATALTGGDWAGCIRESIHAVESAAKSLDPNAQTLAPALKTLQDRGLHPALSKAFSTLYGYTSDQEGVRHALVLEGAANVGEAEALFMFGACASFVGYLAHQAE